MEAITPKPAGDSPRTCPACGDTVPSAFPEGLCPRCLMSDSTLLLAVEDRPQPGERLESSECGPYEEKESSAPGEGHRSRAPLPEELQPWFPGLEIVELLGAGGMGAVYKARQPRLNRFVALKILTCPPQHYADFALRFEREAQVMARLHHPNIVTIFDFGEIDRSEVGMETLFFFLMEFVDGSDLNRVIRGGGLAPSEALALVPQICEALQFAHDEGVTHRDIKPANILLDRKGQVKIADFGLAKLIQGKETLAIGLTMTGTAMGTPQYMAPEQWESPEKVDHRADIYSLGVVIYELLTGQRPAGVFDPPSKRCQVDKRIDGVVMRAMERDPERRYQEAGEVGDDVTRISAVKTRPRGQLGAKIPARKSPLLLVSGISAVVGLGGWWLWQEQAAKGGSAVPSAATAPAAAAAPPQTAWTPLYREPTELTTLFENPKAVFPDFQSHSALVQDPASGLKLVDGWLTPTLTQVKLVLPSARNAGVRLKVQQSEPGKMDGASLWLRGADRGVVYSGSWRGIIRNFGTSSKAAGYLAERENLVAKKPGETFTLEFYAIGQELICRYEGDELRVREPGESRAIGTLNHVMIRNPVTDIEFINLDGLSEAEALKLAGVNGAVPNQSAIGGLNAAPSKPGRLRASGSTANGRPHDLSKFAAYDDFVDVAGGWGRWVALRANGQTVSSDGKADFTGIARIAASFNSEYAFISTTGKLVIPAYEKWTLPSSLVEGVVDAALGMQHGIALLEGGMAVVFGARYEGSVGDPAQAFGYGTPRWPVPEARALEKVKAVAATVTHAATLHEDGTLSLWGWEGPLKWQADPRQKPLRQLRSTEDGFWVLDEAGQLWHLTVPRNPAPGQPVHITGKPSHSEGGVTHLRSRCWRRKNGDWVAHISTKDGMALMKEAGLSESTAFSLNGGTFDGKPFASLLWVEPGEQGGAAANSPAAVVSPKTALGGPSAPPPFTDREAAEWVLGLGQDSCFVTVRRNGGNLTQVRKLADLPAEPFVVQELRCNIGPEASPELLGQVTDAIVLRLADLKSLKLAEIRGNVTGTSLKVMAHHPGLESLLFEGMNLKAEDLRHLQASRLQSLSLPLLRVADPDSLAVLAAMANLRILQIDGSLDPAIAAALPKLPRLEILRANNSATLTDDVLPLLVERFPHLANLQLWGAKKLKGTTLSSLMALKSLTLLGLTDTQVNDETLAQIAGMPQLLTLDLGQTRITDACLPTLESFPKLESLQIFRTELTDAALQKLASVRSLKKLGIKVSGYGGHQPKVTFTDLGIAAFEKLRPDVEVVK